MTDSARSTTDSRRRFRGISAAERQARRRQQLLDAGLEAFGTRGFHAVGVRDICVGAHLTERYFYESFQNREALFLAVYDDAVRQVHAAIDEALGQRWENPVDLARGATAAFLASIKQDPRLARVLFIEALTVSAAVGDQSRVAVQSFSDLALRVIEALYPDLGSHGLDPELLASGLVGSTLSIAMQWASNGFSQPLEHVLEQCVLFYHSLTLHLATLQDARNS